MPCTEVATRARSLPLRASTSVLLVDRIAESDALTSIITTGINLPNRHKPRRQTETLERHKKRTRNVFEKAVLAISRQLSAISVLNCKYFLQNRLRQVPGLHAVFWLKAEG